MFVLPQLSKEENKLLNKTIGLKTRKCAVCGAEFDAGKNYAYKVQNGKKAIIYYCSYSCYREKHK